MKMSLIEPKFILIWNAYGCEYFADRSNDNIHINLSTFQFDRTNRRQQIDQDAREVRIIKEMLFEEEEEKGDRERKFRWKHLDTTANLSDVNELVDGDDPIAHDSDDDNEVEWRRVRFEREQLLKQQMSSNETHEEVSYFGNE